MKVEALIELLRALPAEREIIVQDCEGEATLKITGVWMSADIPYPGADPEPVQLTTTEG